MAVIIFGCTFSFLAALILGFVILRHRAQEKAKLLLWAERQRNLKDRTQQSAGTWHDNRHMDMR